MVGETERRDALTVDLEEYFHATIFRKAIPRKEWDSRGGRAARSVERLLSLFEETGVRATFFVVGWFAERNRSLVRSIAGAGHELASHGWDHRQVHNQSPDEFREDVRRSRHFLEDLAGGPVTGYRAPTFSITKKTLWAIPILAEEGYIFDSSVFPIRHDRYGFPSFPRQPVRLLCGEAEILEFPMTTCRFGRWNLPIAGGGYLRHLPLSWIEKGLAGIRREGGASVLYVHPWEIDPDQPRLPLPFLSAFRHYRGLDRMEGRIRRLIRAGRYAPMGEVLGSIDPPPYRVGGI